MSDIGNKDIFARNLRFYIERSGMDRRQLANTWGFPYSTVTDWINAKKYPRIDRIQIMANYFGILMSDLIEDKDAPVDGKGYIISSATYRMENDDTFLDLVRRLNDLYPEQLHKVISMIDILIG